MTDILMAPASDWSTHSHHSHYEDDRSSTVSMDEVDSIPTSPNSTHSYIRSRDTSPMIRSPRDPHDKRYPPTTSRNLFPHEKSYTYPQHDPHYPHAYITPKQPHYTGTILSDEDDREAQYMHDRMINNLSKLLAVAKSGVDGISEDESTIILQDLGVNVSDLPPPSAQKRLSLPPAATTTPQPHVITPTSDVMAMVSTPSSHAPSTPPQHPLSPLPSSTYSPAKSEQSTSSYHHLQSNLEQLQAQLQQHQYQCEQLKHEKDVLNQTLQQFQTSITHTQDELSRQLLIVTSELTAKDAALVALKEERDEERVSHMQQMEDAKYKLEMMTKQEEQVRQERDRIFNELTSLQQTHTSMTSHHRDQRDKLKLQLASLQQQCDQLIHEKQILRDVMKEATDGMAKELEKAVAELKMKESLLDTLTTQVSSHTNTTQEMEYMRQQWQHVQQQCHALQQEKEKLTHELSDYHAREQTMLHERSTLTSQLQDISAQLITLRQQHTDEVTHSTSLTAQLHAWKQQAENVKTVQNEHHELVTTLQAENEMLRKQKIDIQQAHAATEASLLARLSSLLERLATNDRDYTTLIQQQTAQIESLTQRGEQLQHELREKEEAMRVMQTAHEKEIASLHHRLGGVEDELETRTNELHIANNTIHTLTMKLEYLMRRSYSKGQVLEIVFCLQLVLLVSYLALDWSNGLVMGTQPTFS